MSDSNTEEQDAPVPQTLRIVDVIDCVAANAPDANGRPVSMVTFAHLGELDQPLCVSYDDTKLLVTKLLQALADHGNEFAKDLLERYFPVRGREGDDQGPDDDEDD